MTPIERCLDEREPPLPWLSGLAARFAGEDPDAMATDPGVLARSLGNAVDLFGLPAVAVSLDPTVAASAMAATGSVGSPDDAVAVDVDAVTTGGTVPTLLEATERLAATTSASVLGAVPGPATLAAQLLADGVDDPATVEEAEFTAGEAATELADAFLSRGADGIALLEPAGLDTETPYAEAVTPVRNVTDHYEAVVVLLAARLETEAIERAGAARLDAVTGGVEDVEVALAAADEAGVVLGVGIPDDRFLDGTAAEFADSLPAGTLTSSCLAVPAGTDPATLHALMGSG